MKNKICLVSLTASHYRKLIYILLEKELECEFIFGKSETTIKQLPLEMFRHAENVDNIKLGWGNWYKMPRVIRKLKDYDVIIDDMGIFCITSWRNLIYAKLRNQKVYLWAHGWYGRENFVKKWMKRIYCSLAGGMFVYSNYARELMILNGFNSQKIHVIHNSLDYDTQLIYRNNMQATAIYKDHFGNDAPVLIFIGRLTKVKKLDMILNAVALLKLKGKSYNVVFVGDGNEEERLEKLAIKLSVSEQVWFYGACYDEAENATLIYNADLCVAPGNIGLTAMHSMMFGCPCLSHNDYPWQMPEFEAIIEQKTGMFFKKDDVQSLADSIERWFQLNCNLREQVRNNCYKEIDDNWNPHKQIEIIKKVIYGL